MQKGVSERSRIDPLEGRDVEDEGIQDAGVAGGEGDAWAVHGDDVQVGARGGVELITLRRPAGFGADPDQAVQIRRSRRTIDNIVFAYTLMTTPDQDPRSIHVSMPTTGKLSGAERARVSAAGVGDQTYAYCWRGDWRFWNPRSGWRTRSEGDSSLMGIVALARYCENCLHCRVN